MGKSYKFYIKTMKSIGFTYKIPRYIKDRQNYIGFTYKSPITYLYLFTVRSLISNMDDKHEKILRINQIFLFTTISRRQKLSNVNVIKLLGVPNHFFSCSMIIDVRKWTCAVCAL